MKLETMAREMRQQLGKVQKGWLHQKLNRGLHLVLERKEEQWRLAVGRSGVFPSEVEIEICRDAFDVPVDTQQQWLSPAQRITRRQNGKYQGFFLVEMYWREVEVTNVGLDAGIGGGRADDGCGALVADAAVAAAGGGGRGQGAEVGRVV